MKKFIKLQIEPVFKCSVISGLAAKKDLSTGSGTDDCRLISSISL
jgi:hypothetical protein